MSEFQKSLSELTHDYWCGISSIKVLNNPSSIEFLREAVSCYEPVLIRGLQMFRNNFDWNQDYLSQNSNFKVNVNVTPDGLADCVKEISDASHQTKLKYFTYPLEVNMTMKDFFQLLQKDRGHNASDDDRVVPYLSEQNDNLRTKFPKLFADLIPNIDLARDSFGSEHPEAVNLWIGDERSVSSIHKDHFENFYGVISGEKLFTLLPPTDVVYLNEQVYPTAKYELKDTISNELDHSNLSKHDLVLKYSADPTESISWISLDPDDPNVCNSNPDFAYAHPLRVKVLPGEVLYIPAMWYHRVTQSTMTVAVNYWYNQRFDFRFVFYKTVQMISTQDNKAKQQFDTSKVLSKIV